MQMLEEVKKLPESLLEDLDHLVETRLVELGLIKDPYELNETQRLALDEELMNHEAENADEGPGELFTDLEETGNGHADQIPAALADWLEKTQDGEQLQAIYSLTREAVLKAEGRYNTNIPSGEEWKKLFGI